ncbi:steroid alpha reductase-like protein [Bisporella sp. PMI_857]|nr:steroid alpha reductase-like protein [Bisporella sp. PMI_857]
MATTLKVINRSGRKPIKSLPTTINITERTSVQDVKVALAKQAGGLDPNRLGIFDSKKKLLKDHKALVSRNKEVVNTKEILVKDLGPQISWLTVFVIEYAGPIVIHLAFLFLRNYIYKTSAPLSTSQKLSAAMIILHFVKREYETLFVHKFSLNTMPVRNIFKNSAHYWVLSGLNIAYWIYGPNAPTAKSSPTINYLDVAGVALYLFGELSNWKTHITLSNLRSPGGTERGIPKGYGFNLVTCPNYFFETLAWVGVLLVTKSIGTGVFLVFAFGQMYQWAWKKEKALRAEFPDKYKKKRTVILPFVAI